MYVQILPVLLCHIALHNAPYITCKNIILIFFLLCIISDRLKYWPIFVVWAQTWTQTIIMESSSKNSSTPRGSLLNFLVCTSPALYTPSSSKKQNWIKPILCWLHTFLLEVKLTFRLASQATAVKIFIAMFLMAVMNMCISPVCKRTVTSSLLYGNNCYSSTAAAHFCRKNASILSCCTQRVGNSFMRYTLSLVGLSVDTRCNDG